MSLEHFPGAIPKPRPWLGRGAVKGVSPGGPGRAGLCHGRSPARTGGRQTEARPGGVLCTLDGGDPAQAYTLGRDGSGLRAPSRHQVSASHARAWRGEEGEERREVIGMDFAEEAKGLALQGIGRISEAVEEAWGEVPQGLFFWARYARRLGTILGAEVEPAPSWEVPREVLHEVGELVGWEGSDFALRLRVRALRIRFANRPALVFWLVFVFDHGEASRLPNFFVVAMYEAPAWLSAGSSGRLG